MCGTKTRLDSEGLDVYPDRADAIGRSDRHGRASHASIRFEEKMKTLYA
jgi:hypothetical protein